MTSDRMNPINRRAALGLIGAPVALAAMPSLAMAATAARPWLGTPEQEAAEKMLLQLLRDPELKRIQAKIRADLAATPRGRSIPDAAATIERAVAQWTNSLIFAEMNKNPGRTAFLWGTEDTPRHWLGHHLGGVGTSGDNPDNIYRGASLDGAGRYEIIGQYHPEGRPTQMLFEIGVVDIAKPNTMMTPTARGRAPDPQPTAQLNEDQLIVDVNGRFRITLGATADSSWASPNHLVLPGAGHCSVNVRDVLVDWKLRAAGLSIRRLDKVAAAAPWGIEDVRKLVHADLPEYIAFWSKFPDIWFRGLKPNSASMPQQRPGGWGFVAGLNFHLGPGEAMVLTTSPGEALYTGNQVTDPWMIAPDARTHQVCLNKSQVTPNADGTVTYVIGPDDTGAANWLDTVGLRDGYLVLRWQKIPAGMSGEGLVRDYKVVKTAELAKLAYPRVTPAQRRATVAARAHLYETRTR